VVASVPESPPPAGGAGVEAGVVSFAHAAAMTINIRQAKIIAISFFLVFMQSPS